MDQGLLDIAGGARFFLDSCDVSEPIVDIVTMAEAWGVPVIEGLRTAFRDTFIEVNARAPLSTQRFGVAHEMSHLIARHVGLDPQCERIASGIASATLMPDAAWKRDLGETEWDLEALCPAYGVSLEVAARRITETRSAIVSRWEGGRLAARWRSSWLQGRGFSASGVPAWERDLAGETERYVCHLREGDVRTWWTPGRVWVVSPVEAWEAHRHSRTACRSSLGA